MGFKSENAAAKIVNAAATNLIFRIFSRYEPPPVEKERLVAREGVRMSAQVSEELLLRGARVEPDHHAVREQNLNTY